jgi:hypothetical protein
MCNKNVEITRIEKYYGKTEGKRCRHKCDKGEGVCG